MDAPAFELKYRIDERVAKDVEAWARRHMTVDANADPDGTYRTTSVYCDTPEFSTFWRTPAYYKPRKFRVRRYGNDAVVYLERKTRWGDRVAKRRTSIPMSEVPMLASETTLADWAGHDYHRRLRERRLTAACQIVYLRTAFVNESLRLTLDRNIQGAPMREWSFEPRQGRVLLPDGVILELKFRSTLPASAKGLVADFRLAPTAVSKYRLCWEAWGRPAPMKEAARA